MGTEKSQYWVCIIGPIDRSKFPKEVNGFDSVPRMAAIEAIEKYNISVPNCWSGWGCDKPHFDAIMEVWNKE